MTYDSSHRILALDMATVTGWSMLTNGVMTSGSESFARYAGCKSKPADHQGQNFFNFDGWLREKLRTDKPAVIAYEKAGFFKSAAAVDVCVGFRAVMMTHAAARGIPVFAYAPMSVKKFWTGSGKAEKSAMIAEALNRFPEYEAFRLDDNEADAIALLHLHLSTLTK